MKNKRGLSQVVSVVIIIAIVMAAGVMVWTFVENMVSERMESTKSCYDVQGKVKIVDEYTCYDFGNKSLRLFIEVEDVELDGLLISITGKEGFTSFELSSDPKALSGISNYPSRSGAVAVPGKNEGDRYLITDLAGISREYMSISVAPKANGEQCNTADSMDSVYTC